MITSRIFRKLKGAVVITLVTSLPLGAFAATSDSQAGMQPASTETHMPVESTADKAYTGNLAERIKQTLAAYKGVSADVADGVVLLTGMVDSQEDKKIVVKLARETNGVLSVNDKLHVKGEDADTIGAYFDDAAITSVVKGKIFGQKGLDSLDISVTTTNGVVTLSGEVDSPKQIILAEDIAKQTNGVVKVVNQLKEKR